MSNVFYICDRTACESCNPDCNHTSDITHAVNFYKVPSCMGESDETEIFGYFEKEKVE